MVIIFDLDDTLYEDRSFVLSGFHAVAHYLESILEMNERVIMAGLVAELDRDRNQVFDRFLQKMGKSNKKLVRACVSIYRGHDPKIKLYPEAKACLHHLSKYPLYVVTDGNKLVQKKKCLALGLPNIMKKCLYTHAYGLQNSKPSPYCFELICRWERVKSSEVVYIADNPYKDFVGIKPLGFRTIRVLTGPYRDCVVTSIYDAELTVNNLNEACDKVISLLN